LAPNRQQRARCYGMPGSARYFKLLSADPNTVFQFFVFPDRLLAQVRVLTAAA